MHRTYAYELRLYIYLINMLGLWILSLSLCLSLLSLSMWPSLVSPAQNSLANYIASTQKDLFQEYLEPDVYGYCPSDLHTAVTLFEYQS